MSKCCFCSFVFTVYFRLLYSYHNLWCSIKWDLMSFIVIQNYGSVLSIFVWPHSSCLFFFLSLVLMGFRRGTGLCRQISFRHRNQSIWAVMRSKLVLDICFFPWILTRVFCMWYHPPPPLIILNNYIVVLYIFDKNY